MAFQIVMHARTRRLACLMLMIIWGGGCALQAPDQRSGALYFRHALAPVEEVRFSHLISWQPIGSEAVLLRLDQHRYYLFGVTAPCEIDLRWARSLSLINQTPHRINRFDRVRVAGQDCRITQIQPLDMDALQAELKERGLRPRRENRPVGSG